MNFFHGILLFGFLQISKCDESVTENLFIKNKNFIKTYFQIELSLIQMCLFYTFIVLIIVAFLYLIKSIYDNRIQITKNDKQYMTLPSSLYNNEDDEYKPLTKNVSTKFKKRNTQKMSYAHEYIFQVSS
jgi:predicted PurR-regulated permease PerM